MKTITTILSVIRYLPAVIAFIGKLREAFGSEKVQEAIQALNDFIGKIAPPAPTTDSTGTISANTEKEKQRRFGRLINRTRLAGRVTDREIQTICQQTGTIYNDNYDDQHIA